MTYEQKKHHIFGMIDDLKIKQVLRFIPYDSDYREFKYFGNSHDMITDIVEFVQDEVEFEISDEEYRMMLEDAEFKQFAENTFEAWEDWLMDEFCL